MNYLLLGFGQLIYTADVMYGMTAPRNFCIHVGLPGPPRYPRQRLYTHDVVELKNLWGDFLGYF